MQRQIDRSDHGPLGRAREAVQAAYLADGDTANAGRLRILDQIQDRTRVAAFLPADLDQLLELLQESGLDSNVVITVFTLLLVAAQRGQVPSEYRERLRRAALGALEGSDYAGRQGGIVLLFALGARQDQAAIAALVNDPNDFVSKAARDVLGQWAQPAAPRDP